MQLESVRAVVTGGARGMGRAFVEQLKAAGAQVFFCDISEEGVTEASAALDAPGTVADVSNEEDVARLFAEATAAMGGAPNVLLNNAGIIRDAMLVKKDRTTGEIKLHSKERWDSVIAVNLTGPFLCTREFSRRVIDEGVADAVIVNMSSISRAGNRGQSSYSATKAGIVADTTLWAGELARYGIRVGAIAPGFINTPMVASMRPEVLEKVIAPVPLKRLGEPEEIWLAIKFILECDYFTGRVIEVDGGLRL